MQGQNETQEAGRPRLLFFYLDFLPFVSFLMSI